MTGTYRTTLVTLRSGNSVKVYASPKVRDALHEISGDMSLYQGVRLTTVLDAVYVQGKKDGARQVFEGIDEGVAKVKRVIPHRAPGRPKKKKLK